MEIKILGPGCAKCNKTFELVLEVLEETGIKADVEKISDMMQIASYGIFGTPSVIIDGKVKCTGKVPKKKELIKWLK